MPSLPRLTLSLRQLLILLTALGLLPLALLGAWSLHAAGEYQEREQERLMLDLARALSSAADAELDAIVAILTTLGRAQSLQDGDLRGFHAVASAMARAQPEWLGVTLSDESGTTLMRSMDPYGAPSRQAADPDSLRQALALRQPLVGHMARGAHGRAAFPVRVPVSDAHGRQYILTAVVRPDRISRLIERQQVPGGAVTAIRDAGRLLVARSQDQARMVGAPPSASLVALMARVGAEGVGTARTTEGQEVATAYTTLSRYGWTVVVGRPREELRAAALKRLGVYGAGILASLLICIALASLLSRRLLLTIRTLQQNAASLGSGAPLTLAPSSISDIEVIGEALLQAERQRGLQERERKQLLDSLSQALASQHQALTEARDAGRAKDEFLAVLGHELRNPLSPIVTSLDLLDRRDEPAGRRERAIMRRQVNHLRRLVDDLLDVSRITSGKLQIDILPVNLADVVRHAVAAVPALQVGLSAPEAIWVLGDESRLTQVLNNLLSNAARFGSSATEVALRADGGQAMLLVSDNGIGMSAELLARVFEPFHQAPQSLARNNGGLGLGLAIVRKLVELHGGQVAARSAGEGAGSQFELRLPLAAAPFSSHLPAPFPAIVAGNATGMGQATNAGLDLLLVDDNIDAAATAAALLELLGHTVRVAHTAAAALEATGQRMPQVAILDIGLPDMDGYALAAAIRTQANAQADAQTGTQSDTKAGASAPRLVALTGYGQQEDVARARAARFDLHLTKPASLADLRRAAMPLESDES
jgi:signal transduction histidine kinase/ActR/RegA family two-component response regulator